MAEEDAVPGQMEWPDVNELDSAFSSFILDPSAHSQSPSVGISPMTLHWLQNTLGTTSAGPMSAPTSDHSEIPLVSPPNAAITPNDASKEEFRGEAIDWKALNETFEENAAHDDDGQWKDIPQFRPVVVESANEPSLQKLITSTVFSIWPLNNLASTPASASAAAAPPGVATRLPPHEYAADSNKRKAIISPEFVQYESTPTPVVTRRPSKKSDSIKKTEPRDSPVLGPVSESQEARCKCTGKCRNARCACVKAGKVCGSECKCVNCQNPFAPMVQCGIDPIKMITDKCLMQNLSRIKDMHEVLQSNVDLECSCGAPVTSVRVFETLLQPVEQPDHTFQFPFKCAACPNTYQFSWCTGKLWWTKQPRKHCEICKRCGSHRNQHCYDCGHCYFAGVANSFACPCKAAAAEGAGAAGSNASSSTAAAKADPPSSSPLFHEDVSKDDEKEQCPVQ